MQTFVNNTLSNVRSPKTLRNPGLLRIGFSLACAAVMAFSFAGIADAQAGIDWISTGGFVGKGYLPKSASDGADGTISIFQTGTGFGQIAFNVGIDGSTWDGQANISAEIGHAPSIAMVVYEESTGNVGDAVIDVHQGGQDSGSALWSRVGYPTNPFLLLAPSNITWVNSQNYDSGYNPTVAIDGWTTPPTVVEVHQAGENSSALWYHVGKLVLGTSPHVSWGPSHEFDSGFTGFAPSVSVSDGLVILAAQGSGGTLWKALGVVNTSAETIGWGKPATYAAGFNPSVSLTGDFNGDNAFEGDWELVEVHQATKGTGSLWYNTGYLKAASSGSYPKSITWTTPTNSEYAGSGCYPTVTQFNGGTTTNFYVMETHSEDCGEAAKIVSELGFLKNE
jgi:hypothetical protein